MKPNVALALASGGPRGFAYIGAIEELQARGYKITSVAGASAGSLVGGIFAAGGLEPFKKWLFSLDPVKVMTLMDVSVSKNYLVKGEKVINEIKSFVPDVNIEDLPIPFTAIATDLYTGEEVIFREGPLFNAIRASISIPSMFKPVVWKGRTLVDGGMVNTFPLNRVQRTPGDILVGFNVNQIDAAEIQGFLDSRAAIAQERESEHTLLGRIQAGIQAGLQQRQLEASANNSWIPVGADDNFASILQRSFGIMNCSLARIGIELTPPDVLASLPYDSYHGVYGYSHAEEIATLGRRLMADALDQYEKKNA
ncbi:MAG: patatin-like phospholipase family protein [Bacteroidales bacterium]|jgi:NTE family protein|nr:patatin-like phospholipase family protein [Bacteroidales bacterium]